MSNPFIINKAPKLNKSNVHSLEIERSRIFDKDLFKTILSRCESKIKTSSNSAYNQHIAQSTYAGLLVSYMFGLRPQEVVGLKWSDLKTDKNGHSLTIERAVTISKNQDVDSKFTTKPILKGTKTGSTRSLTVGSKSMEMFRAYKDFSDRYFEDERWSNPYNLMSVSYTHLTLPTILLV